MGESWPLSKVVEDCRRIGRAAFPSDGSVANEKRAPRRKTKERRDVKSGSDFSLRIREQIERQMVARFERPQTLYWIAADSENLNPALVQLIEPTAKSAGVRRADGRAGSQIEIDEDRPALVGRAKIDDRSILIHDLQGRCALADLQTGFVCSAAKERCHIRRALIFASSVWKCARSLIATALIASMADR